VKFSTTAIDALKEYAWPGNIRELRNVVERLLLLAGDEVNMEDVRLALPATGESGPVRVSSEGEAGPLAQRVLAFERKVVLAELERHGRRATQTARALGLERSHLYKKCQQLGIDMQNPHERD
jgi:two-component system nitrogen regulation response regulator NtrX